MQLIKFQFPQSQKCFLKDFSRIIIFYIKIKRVLQSPMNTPLEFCYQISDSRYYGTKNDLVLDFYGNFKEKLSFLFEKIKQNQFLIAKVKHVILMQLKKIDSCLEKIEFTEQNYGFDDQFSSSIRHAVKIENFHQQLSKFSNFSQKQNLKQKLFGRKQYRYRITLDNSFPAQVFKERNFQFKVKVVDERKSIIKNNNSLRVCLEVCDNDGNWVGQSSEGLDFIKGNSEIEIYHGVGQFSKVAARDISRGYKDKQLNFVIYSMPSSIKYNDSVNAQERWIESSQIQPLIIEKIHIMAKRSKQ